MQLDAEENVGLTGDDAVVVEAIERWRATEDWEGVPNERSREDTKFANGDARNAWQWPTKIYQERTADGNEMPCLTINTTRVHNDIIINQISKNGFGAKVRPTGGKASYASAQIMQTLIDRIQYISKGSAQRRKVCEQQVDGGVGYMLIETAFVSERSHDQDIYLRASRDPTGVRLDPWIREPDGSDANFGFVVERLQRKEFNRKYPEFKNKVGTAPIDSSFASWISDKEIMLVKYFRKKESKDTFVAYTTDDGQQIEKLASEIRSESGKDIYDALIADIKDGKIDGRTRSVNNNEVEWFLIAGDTVIDKGEWAGKYIPICRAVGRELVVDATLDRKGHTRPMIDAQRMLNYNASMAVEIVALQPKSPYMAPARSIEGQEQYKTLNINGFPVILYNDIDDEAPEGMQRIDPPQRQAPPSPSTAHEQALQTAERQMMMISGQFQNQLGQTDPQSAASGRAISERKEQGDTATYHFQEHLADMDRLIGVQLLDLIPKIYDTKRTLHIQGEDGEKSWIMIDPNQDEIIRELQDEKKDEEAIKIAFNPKWGQYECVSDPGPSFATRRQEAWNAMSIILQQNMQLAGVIGDLLFKFGDFPGSEEIMERLQKEIKATKPYLFDDQAEPQMQALQQANQRLTALNSELMTKLADEKLKVRSRDERRDIDAYNADTKRMEIEIRALKELLLTPSQKAQFEHEIEMRGHEHIYSNIENANEQIISSLTKSAPTSNGAGQ